MSKTQHHRESQQLLTFTLGEQWFGIPIHSVMDVMYTPTLTPVPLVNSTIGGLLNLRGRIVTSIKTNILFHVETGEDSSPTMSIVLQDDDDEMFSFIVDKVFDIEDFPADDFEKLPSNLHDKWSPFARGINKSNDRLVIVLDHKKILDQLH